MEDDNKRIGKREVILAAVFAGLGVVLFVPVINYFAGAPRPLEVAPDVMAADSNFLKVADVLTRNCANCHRADPAAPWYLSLPWVGSMMRSDMAQGRAAWDMTETVTTRWAEMPEAAMAKLESVMWQQTMPPARYRALHWYAGLDAGEKREISNWIAVRRKAARNDKRVAIAFVGEPIAPLPFEASDVNADKVALGNTLFHDARLSGDNTIACSSCHDLAKGGTDQERFATGINAQVGGINSPTVYNAVYNVVQFWNGRAANLKEQAGGPVENPIEMGATFEQVVAKLNGVPEYVAAFNAVYPEGISKETITDAIAEFESTLITPNARFDRYLMGEKALSPEEIAGYDLFKNRGCTSCHFGVAIGGTHFEKMGKVKDYFASRGGEITDADLGRFAVTKNEGDRHFFKVPTLRNVAVTHPYFHDGTKKDLEQAVKAMGEFQLSTALSEKDAELVTAFLGSLTGEYHGQSLDKMAPPSAPVEEPKP